MGDDPNGRAIQHYNLDWYYERRECANYDNAGRSGSAVLRRFDTATRLRSNGVRFALLQIA
jgi:hypothetical protein